MVEDIATHSRVYDRVEVHAGSGRRRRWTADQKGAIVAASFAPGVRASDVARRFDISPQHLFLWRRAARRGQLVLPCGDEVGFAAVAVDDARFCAVGGGLEVEIAGAVVRVTAGSDLRLLAGVVRVLKAAV